MVYADHNEDENLPMKTWYNRKIECVTVSVGYSDFLCWTLPFNKHYFDKTIVVTTENDKETQNICRYWNVEFITTNKFYENSDSFNKAKGINVGLANLSQDDWIVHMDADIYLPPRTREVLQTIPLDDKTLYSVDRLNCKNFIDWIKYLQNPESQHGMDGLLHFNRFENGSRLVNLNRDGYVGMGFLQLWNPDASKIYEYPDKHSHADRSDILFSYNFSRLKRQLLPELMAIHLETTLDYNHPDWKPMGINWSGRKSPNFSIDNI